LTLVDTDRGVTKVGIWEWLHLSVIKDCINNTAGKGTVYTARHIVLTVGIDHVTFGNVREVSIADCNVDAMARHDYSSLIRVDEGATWLTCLCLVSVDRDAELRVPTY
jgi:hypothetical protein